MVDFNEHRAKHLEFIEDVISRQAHNSFAIRGWSLTLSAGIFTFLLSHDASQNIHGTAYFIAILPAILFWLLDAYYLRQERAFRCLYDDVRQDITRISGEQPVVDLFDMNIERYKQKEGYWKAFFSKTVFGIPFMIVFASIALFVIDLLT